MAHPTIKIYTADDTSAVRLTINDAPVGGDFGLYSEALEYAEYWCNDDLLVTLAETDGVVLGLQSDRVQVTRNPDSTFKLTWASYPLADVVKEGDLKFDPFGTLMNVMFDTCDFVWFEKGERFPEMDAAGYESSCGYDMQDNDLREALCGASDVQIRMLLADLQYATERVKALGGGY